MQDSSSSASNRIPVAETVHGAIELARSGGAITMIYAAAQLANYRERPLGPRELFLAALALGMRPLSRGIDEFAADPWLYDCSRNASNPIGSTGS